MRIKIYKPNSPLSAYNQFISEFQRLGHEITDERPEVLLHLSGFFSELLEDAKQFPDAKKVGILLDGNPLTPHPYWNEIEVRNQLLQLDLALTISETSRKQILKRTGVDCKVVYYPMKPLKRENVENNRMFLWVGRISGSKRFNLCFPTLQKLGYDPENLIIVGPEKANFGLNTGIVTDEELNFLYNSCDFVMNTSCMEGIGLSLVESAVLGKNLIACNDLETVHEFGLQEFAADPNPDSLAKKIIEIKLNPDYYKGILDNLRPSLEDKFDIKNVVARILSLIGNK